MYLLDPKQIQYQQQQSNESQLCSFLQRIKGKFNRSQQKCIEKISQGQEGMYLLQGPPGTGKTHTLLGIVSGLMEREKNKKIMICAPSNQAIDTVITRILTQGLYLSPNKSQPRLVRVGLVDNMSSPLIKQVSLENQVQKAMLAQNQILKQIEQYSLIELQDMIAKLERKLKNKNNNDNDNEKDLKDLKEELDLYKQVYFDQKDNNIRQKEKYSQHIDSILLKAQIICCTLSSAGSEKLSFLEGHFQALLIDEAAQCVEPTNLIPFKFNPPQIIMIGDPKQLPATTFSPNSNLTMYNRSLFERMLANKVEPYFLEEQYRMHPQIRAFPSEAFYNGRLQDSHTVQLMQFPSYLKHFQESNHNHIFIDIDDSQELIKHNSYINPQEIDMSLSLLHKLNTCMTPQDYQASSLGFITPYKQQAILMSTRIKQTFPSEFKNILQVNTIDSFQGQEKDIIIISAVRSQGKQGRGKIGFLADERRMNVALTRAKHVQIVVGNAKTLSSNHQWAHYINFMLTNHNYFRIRGQKDTDLLVDALFNNAKKKPQFYQLVSKEVKESIQRGMTIKQKDSNKQFDYYDASKFSKSLNVNEEQKEEGQIVANKSKYPVYESEKRNEETFGKKVKKEEFDEMDMSIQPNLNLQLLITNPKESIKKRKKKSEVNNCKDIFSMIYK